MHFFFCNSLTFNLKIPNMQIVTRVISCIEKKFVSLWQAAARRHICLCGRLSVEDTHVCVAGYRYQTCVCVAVRWSRLLIITVFTVGICISQRAVTCIYIFIWVTFPTIHTWSSNTGMITALNVNAAYSLRHKFDWLVVDDHLKENIIIKELFYIRRSKFKVITAKYFSR